jgi:hypothetical protein
MSETTVGIQVVLVFLMLSVIVFRLITKASSGRRAWYYTLGYLAATVLYMKLIGEINIFFGRNWLDKDYKQGLIFLAAIYFLCLAIALVNILLCHHFRKSSVKIKA